MYLRCSCISSVCDHAPGECQNEATPEGRMVIHDPATNSPVPNSVKGVCADCFERSLEELEGEMAG